MTGVDTQDNRLEYISIHMPHTWHDAAKKPNNAQLK